MRELNENEIGQLDFADSLVKYFKLNALDKSLKFSVEDCHLVDDVGIHPISIAEVSLTPAQSVRAREYANEEWTDLDLKNPRLELREICEYSRVGDLFTFSGFSNESGYWIELEFKGTSATVRAR